MKLHFCDLKQIISISTLSSSYRSHKEYVGEEKKNHKRNQKDYYYNVVVCLKLFAEKVMSKNLSRLDRTDRFYTYFRPALQCNTVTYFT